MARHSGGGRRSGRCSGYDEGGLSLANTYWDDEKFKKKSEQQKNQSQSRVIYTTDSQSFEEGKAAAKDLNQLATSKPELKALCVCLKQAAISFGINGDRAKQIPELCHITVPVPIDPNIDCNSI